MMLRGTSAGGSPEVAGSLLEAAVDLVESRHQHEDRVRDAQDDVGDRHVTEREADAEPRGRTGVTRSRRRGRGSRAGSGAAPDRGHAAESSTGQGERGEEAEGYRAEARQEGDDGARPQRSVEIGVVQELAVPIPG